MLPWASASPEANQPRRLPRASACSKYEPSGDAVHPAAVTSVSSSGASCDPYTCMQGSGRTPGHE